MSLIHLLLYYAIFWDNGLLLMIVKKSFWLFCIHRLLFKKIYKGSNIFDSLKYLFEQSMFL